MNQKHSESLYHANVDVTLVEENVLQINRGITTNVHVIVKNIMIMKKIIHEILLHVVVKMENI